MFIAPLLYAIHAVLTGVSMAVTWGSASGRLQLLGGPIDYVLNWNLATKPWLIIPVGLFAVVYYVVFRFAITKFNLPTAGPGARRGGRRTPEGRGQGADESQAS